MKKEKSEVSGLKKMDNFQKTVIELEKFQEVLDDTDNPMTTLNLQACLGHINSIIITLCEQMSDIKQKAIRVLGVVDKEGSKKKLKETEIYHI